MIYDIVFSMGSTGSKMRQVFKRSVIFSSPFEINMEGEGRTLVGRQDRKEQENTIFLKTLILTVMML